MLRAILYGWREWFVVVIICIYIVNIVVVMWRAKMLYVIHLQLANSRYICIKILRIMLCCVVIWWRDAAAASLCCCIILIVFTILLVFFLFNLSLGYLIIVILFMVFCSIISWWLYLYIYSYICICTYIHSYIK